MNIYLIQHAEAKSKEEDPQRPLSETGKKNIREVSTHLAKMNIMIQEIWHSEKLRAKETAKIVAETLHFSEKFIECPGLTPNDAVMKIKQKLQGATKDTAIVSHLPFLGKLASLLLCGREETNIITFKMGGVLCLHTDDLQNWSVEWMLVPNIVNNE